TPDPRAGRADERHLHITAHDRISSCAFLQQAVDADTKMSVIPYRATKPFAGALHGQIIDDLVPVNYPRALQYLGQGIAQLTIDPKADSSTVNEFYDHVGIPEK